MAKALPSLAAGDAARLLLDAAGLLDDPARRATRPALRRLVERLGFVQLDSIHVLARAHDLALWSRLEGYRPDDLRRLRDERFVFEHWTHDASVIPVASYAHWKPRFRRDRERLRASRWWRGLLGDRADETLTHVRERIGAEGPLMSADFEHPQKRGAWWDWKPQKAALDYLWRSGELAVRGRVHFHKVYDLAERVFPVAHALPEPEAAAHCEWLLGGAAERLVVFTPSELAGFWAALDLADVKAWCAFAAKEGRLVPVLVEAADGTPPAPAYALADWPSRLRRAPEAPSGARLLSPFDPVIRDRARCLRRFGFDYRFEAFTPPGERQYGYYVLPILEGERLVGRLDPKLHRSRGVLEIKGVFWEPSVRVTARRRRALGEAVERLAAFVGASQIEGVP